jgi:hypothetical protein
VCIKHDGAQHDAQWAAVPVVARIVREVAGGSARHEGALPPVESGCRQLTVSTLNWMWKSRLGSSGPVAHPLSILSHTSSAVTVTGPTLLVWFWSPSSILIVPNHFVFGAEKQLDLRNRNVVDLGE